MEPAPAPSTDWQRARETAAAPVIGEAGPAVIDAPDPAGSSSSDPASAVLLDPTELPPGDLLDSAAAGERWTVLYTRSRCEKKAARACARLGIRHYLPLREMRASSGRHRAHQVPLFPGYVFACLGPSAREPLLEGGAIARVIPVPHPALLLDELRQIRRALAAGVDLAAGPSLARGMLVRVASGLLSGVVGRVAWVRRRRVCLVLNVTLLGRGAVVEVDAEAVAAVGSLSSGAAPGVAEEGVHYGGRRPWRVRRGRVVGDSLVGAV